jgi:hypothetical protein
MAAASTLLVTESVAAFKFPVTSTEPVSVNPCADSVLATLTVQAIISIRSKVLIITVFTVVVKISQGCSKIKDLLKY